MKPLTMPAHIVPQVHAVDDDDLVVALETARVSEERGDVDNAVKWLQRAAAAARKQGRPDRAGVLSRAAAQLAGNAEQFERKPNESQTLEALSDDFADSTIVDSAETIAGHSSEDVGRPGGSEADHGEEAPEGRSAQPNPENSRDLSVDDLQQVDLDDPTPLAPLFDRGKAQPHQAIRVAVRRTLGGRFEARPLQPGDVLGKGEHEALLVPVASETKW